MLVTLQLWNTKEIKGELPPYSSDKMSGAGGGVRNFIEPQEFLCARVKNIEFVLFFLSGLMDYLVGRNMTKSID